MINSPGRPAVGSGAFRGLGHSADWIHDGKRVPAMPALWSFARWRSVQPVDPDRTSRVEGG